MKKLLLILLLSTSLYSQTISVKGVTLEYTSQNNTMVLVIPKDLIKVTNKKDQLQVILSKSYSLSINGNNVSHCFKFTGYKFDSIRSFDYESSIIVIFDDNTQYYLFKFENMQPDEYILEVLNTIQDNKQSKSLIIK